MVLHWSERVVDGSVDNEASCNAADLEQLERTICVVAEWLEATLDEQCIVEGPKIVAGRIQIKVQLRRWPVSMVARRLIGGPRVMRA